VSDCLLLSLGLEDGGVGVKENNAGHCGVVFLSTPGSNSELFYLEFQFITCFHLNVVVGTRGRTWVGI
jgi:hypothetical protein